MTIGVINTYVVPSAGTDNTTLTTPSFTPSAGEILVIELMTWDTANGMSAPTESSSTQTLQHIQTAAPGGFNGWAGTWVCKVTGSPGSITVSSAPATGGNTRHLMVVKRLSGADLAATPATNATVNGFGSTTASTTLTTTAANSWISWCMVDENARDPASSTYISTSGTPTQDGLYDGHVGNNSVQYSVHQTAPTAGSNTFGLTNSIGSVTWVAVGVEILAEVATPVSGSDTGAGADAVSALSVTSASADTSSGAETASLVVSISSADTASGIDAASADVSVSSADASSSIEGVSAFSMGSADSAVTTEWASVFDGTTIQASSADNATAVEGRSLSVQLSASDAATATEAAGRDQSPTATDIVQSTESAFVTVLPEKARTVRPYPYFIRETQSWAIEQERRRHNEALYQFGESTMFCLLWHILDFNSGLVERCPTCYEAMGEIAEVYGQPSKNKCLDCFGTSFEGGFKALIVRPAIFSDSDESESVTKRGLAHPQTLSIDSTPDFRIRTGDYCFRATGERYYLRAPERVTVRSGFGEPSQLNAAIAYNHANAAEEDPTSVAYKIPPSNDEIAMILGQRSRVPRNWSTYEVIRAPLIPDEGDRPSNWSGPV